MAEPVLLALVSVRQDGAGVSCVGTRLAPLPTYGLNHHSTDAPPGVGTSYRRTLSG
ncbi:hypothetical protein [Methylicorpusculum sp.]|uniref:hypothetical protein n=1 Tax=Methylicorpusculum sp. TaxID=2713644 RepID=UPI0027324D44|nr:hypothetical protein [Methylicorpusculum sp.]MDP3528378.1 hypothetical protein [Methylicorpusculum sp.]